MTQQLNDLEPSMNDIKVTGSLTPQDDKDWGKWIIWIAAAIIVLLIIFNRGG